MVDELNPSRCREIRQNLRETQRAIREEASSIRDINRRLTETRARLVDVRRRLEAARNREIAGQAIGLLPGGPASGAASTAITVEAALAISQLEADMGRLENEVPRLKQDMGIRQQNHSRFETALSSLSLEANQLACII